MVFETSSTIDAKHRCILGFVTEGLVPVLSVLKPPFFFDIFVFDGTDIVLFGSLLVLVVLLGGASFSR